MIRFAFLLSLAGVAHAGVPPVDIDTAAQLYQEAAIREQVRASLGAMPAHIRKLFQGNTSTPLTDTQLDAVNVAATRAFRLDVFEAPALSAFAANLDADTLKKAEAFLETDVGKRMVAADLGLASLSDADADKVMNGDISVPSTPQRDALFEKLERAERSAESTVQILLTMGTAVATGTAVGSGMDPGPVEQRARKSGEASRQTLEDNMREPTRRYLAYGYRDLSDADLKRMLSFLQSTAGKQYISAYLASLGAGFYAMGRRCGEQLGESLRELAMAQLATENAEHAQPAPLKPRP
ncbi:MAG TPA: hypothetical protein VHS76_02190 [Steroidobacteraceae bacterium]|jgi:hypothetical protein|nr:hypothetical protein [Steroidobacteraceae bacterium]